MKQKKQTKNPLQKTENQIKKTPLQQIIFKPNVWFSVLCALTGILLYLNSIRHGYVLDDAASITDNPQVLEGIKGIPKILSVEMWHFYNINLGYYRPFSLITFAIENEFFPKNPHVSHLGNVLLYGLTGFFLCQLMMSVFRNFHPFFSFMITLLFIAHPVHTEVVANIKSRDELLAFLNLVIALFLFLKSHSETVNTKPKTVNPAGNPSIWLNQKILLLSLLFFYFALLSKETALSGFLVAPLLLYFATNYTIRQCLIKSIPLLVIVIFFQLQKYWMLHTISLESISDITNYPYAGPGIKLPSAFMIFFRCLRLVFFPEPLLYSYAYNQIPAVHFSSPAALAGVALSLVLAYFSFQGLKRKSILAFGTLFFCITLVPAMAFVFLRGGILAERFLYAPALGFCIVITFLLMKAAKTNMQLPGTTFMTLIKKMKFIFPLFIIFILYSFKTVERNRAWRDNLTLFSTDVKTSSNNCQVHLHYGNELIKSAMTEKNESRKKEMFVKGTGQLREALKIYPHIVEVYVDLGLAFQNLNLNYDSAIYYYNLAIQESPRFSLSYKNLGTVYESTGKHFLASYYYNKAVEMNPYSPDWERDHEAHVKKTGLDIRVFPSPANLDSLGKDTANNNYNFYYYLGHDHASRGDYSNAIRIYEKAIEINPSHQESYIDLSNCYGMLKNYDKSIEILNKALIINPENTVALGNLSINYDLIGNKNKAMEYRQKVEEISRK